MFDKLQDVLRKYDALQAERRAARRTDPPNVTVPESLCRATELASWMAYFALVYFLWIYTLDIARDRAGNLHITHLGGWTGDLQFWFPHIIGFAVVAIGIPYVAKIAIPTFTRLGWREAPTEKAWALFIAVAVSLVVIAGTFTVQGDNILERDRAGVVATQQAEQENAVLGARIADVQHAMDERTRSESVYVRTAASMSPQAYDRFVESRRGDWQYDRLRSYRSVSEEMLRLNQEMSALRAQQARQTVAAQVAGRVTNGANNWIASTLAWLEGARAMLLSFVMDIVCLIMPLIALRLRLKRNQQIGMAEGIPQHPYMIESHVGEAMPTYGDGVDAALNVLMAGGDRDAAEEAARAAVRPAPVQNKMFDGDGNEIEPVNYPKFRKKPDRSKKGKKQQVEVQAESNVKVPLHDSAGRVTGYAEFTARDVVEKDGRSADQERPSPDIPPTGLEVVVGEEHPAETEEVVREEQHEPDAHEVIGDTHPEPSDPNAALDDLLALETPNEPEQHSTDERADDAAAEEVAEPALVAHESDAVAEEDERLQPRALIAAE